MTSFFITPTMTSSMSPTMSPTMSTTMSSAMSYTMRPNMTHEHITTSELNRDSVISMAVLIPSSIIASGLLIYYFLKATRNKTTPIIESV